MALELGSTTEVVEVTASGSDLQVLNATVGNTVSGDLLTTLPSIGRDTSTFVTLQPGVSPDGSVAGAVVDQSTFMLDGGQNTNDMDGSMQVYTPSFGGRPDGWHRLRIRSVERPTGVMPTPLDSVEEFKVNTTNQTADFNSSAGAQVQVVTKRGTNAWHGTAYEYYFDNNFNANTWDNNANGTPLAQLSLQSRRRCWWRSDNFQGTFLAGKTYFFANFEGFWWPNSVHRREGGANAPTCARAFLHFCADRATTNLNIREQTADQAERSVRSTRYWNQLLGPADVEHLRTPAERNEW